MNIAAILTLLTIALPFTAVIVLFCWLSNRFLKASYKKRDAVRNARIRQEEADTPPQRERLADRYKQG